MRFYNKVNELCMERGISISAMAQELGFSRGTPTNWKMMDKPPRSETVKKIADYFGVTVKYLTSEDEIEKSPQKDIFSYSNIMPITRKRLPLLGEIACGEPVFANEDRDSYVEIGTDINADFCLRAHGDSMIGARIHDGDIVFIKKQEMVDNGEIAAVVIDDEATLKRVYYYQEKGVIILKPENPMFKDIVFTKEELNSIRILGKAVAFQSDVR